MSKAEQLWKAKLVDMACLICERIYGQHSGGDVQLHHLRTGVPSTNLSPRPPQGWQVPCMCQANTSDAMRVGLPFHLLRIICAASFLDSISTQASFALVLP